MATFHIENFGCRATYADADAIARQFAERGYARVSGAAAADVVVLNTCTVTADADACARQAVRRAHRESPQARIIVTGCYAQRAPDELAAIEGVSCVVGNAHLDDIAGLVAQALLPVRSSALVQIERAQPGVAVLPEPAQIFTGDILARKLLTITDGEGGQQCRTRPVLKIQDGCDQRCAYCVIPFVRGRSRSLPPADAVAEVRRLVAGGAKEIVLSGIHLGSYGRDLAPRANLLDLLRCILDETRIERLRLSSIEPMDVTRELVALFATSGRLARHFHVPLQSGSDRILRAMHRWYKAAHYAERVKLVHELLPGAGIGADVIAGFPGETDDDHGATMEFIESLPFTYLHVFSFSSRPGTEAARLIKQEHVLQVRPAIIKQRVHELRALAAKKAASFRAAHAGQSLHALTLHTQGLDSSGQWTAALTDNYLTVHLRGSHEANRWHEVRIP